MTEKRARPWKQYLMKIPDSINYKLSKISSDEILISCLRRIPKSQIEAGIYKHMGIIIVNDKIDYQPSVVPDPRNGRYSKINIYGKEYPLKDKPKIPRTYSYEAPNYGDSSKGWHTIDWTREVYERGYIPPKMLDIIVEVAAFDTSRDSYVIKFTINQVLFKSSADFKQYLFFNLNLLQENVGNHDVVSAGSSTEEMLQTLYVNWELLPPGKREDDIKRIISGMRTRNPKALEIITNRRDFLAKLKPLYYVKGTNGFRNYFGAMFAEDLVVFENIDYGNAVYVMFEDWQNLSKKSRTELLRDRSNFIRIPHTRTWKIRLRSTLAIELGKRKQN